MTCPNCLGGRSHVCSFFSVSQTMLCFLMRFKYDVYT
jgi:hypothetical protein